MKAFYCVVNTYWRNGKTHISDLKRIIANMAESNAELAAYYRNVLRVVLSPYETLGFKVPCNFPELAPATIMWSRILYSTLHIMHILAIGLNNITMNPDYLLGTDYPQIAERNRKNLLEALVVFRTDMPNLWSIAETDDIFIKET
jgi:hypothetical protein